MTARAELVARLLTALSTIDGLRPAPPLMRTVPGRNLDALAIDADTELVQIRLVATALPLPPRLAEAAEAVAKALVGTPYAGAHVRLVVTDVDGAAFTKPPRTGA
ncbi:hypothetical protein FHX82_005331 [Amycolatopsis bartoniae]|uniref:Uncharacterized protein n=1 Tax=Amycolatopsis bartoniae TaxID=941986 RepID=A0A8H9M7H7_9PSEU|nr:hypothetical protein [Amycolatopsis bartoniae]MBB2938255.1 hypothetical protein [Amycolatopsis bartoniae]TVT09030.1 hypothetical protein FNH07_10355 [Amycolatopsis bartoniae]GHF33828.1 hypothetical protein GCM10017566_03090 [Amycolatopsis bartoniae]